MILNEYDLKEVFEEYHKDPDNFSHDLESIVFDSIKENLSVGEIIFVFDIFNQLDESTLARLV